MNANTKLNSLFLIENNFLLTKYKTKTETKNLKHNIVINSIGINKK